MAARKLHVVLNPSAGGGRGAQLHAELGRELGARGIAFDLVETGAGGDAVELAYRAARAGVGIVVAVGGDGTIHEAANGLLRALQEEPTLPATLAVVPVGTGNDFAKMMDARPGRRAAYDRLVQGQRRRIDAATAAWDGGREYFVNAFGTGIDTEVVRAIQPLRRLPRALVYLLGVTRALIGYSAPAVRVRIGQETLEARIMTLAVANGRCIGGSFWICPRAQPDDGLLDVCMVENLPVVRQPLMAVRILRGTHERRREVITRRSTAVEIETSNGGPLELQLDGEPRRAVRGKVRIDVLPGVLPVLAGRRTGTAGRAPVRATHETGENGA